MFERLNRNGSAVLPPDIKLEELEFVKLSRYVGKVIPVKGYFFTNGQFGKQVVVVGLGKKINMPARAVEQFEKISEDTELKEAVLTGGLQINNIQEIKTKNGTKTIVYELEDTMPF